MHDSVKKHEFTLTHLLIIVSVVAVLIAVAIPMLTDRLDAMRAAEESSNIHSSYAAMMRSPYSETCGGAWMYHIAS